MTQTILRKARSLTAAVVGTLFLFTTVATPLVEANFWEQRRDASRRATGKSSDNSTLLASLPASLGKMDGVLPSVHGSLGNVFQSAPPLELSGTPTPADLRASTLPSWLRGLPSSAGEIRQVALAKNAETAPVVVLVQDVHNVLSAQKSIAQIVSHLESAAEKEKRGPVLVGLEGGYRSFDLDRFRAFRDRPGHALVSELLLKTNLISGPEYFAFLAERKPLLWGVETPADYIENVEAVRASHPAVERVTAALNAAQVAVEAKGSEVFSKELKDLNKTLAAQARGDISIVDLVRVLRERAPQATAPEVEKLQKALALEAGIDFARVERERAALIEQLVKVLDAPAIERLVSASLHYRSGQISFSAYHNQLKALVKGRGIQWSDYGVFDQYVQYVLLAESIDKFRLFDELEDLKSKAVAVAGRTSEEKTVLVLAEDLRLLTRLVRHEFGPVEWNAYRTRRDDLGSLQARLDTVLGFEVKGPSMEDVALFERFYRAADQRNDSLVNNLLAKGKETNAKVMALVAGGFHTPELESCLKAKGYSVVTITPQIGEIPQGHAYMDIFLVKHIPIEEFLAGQKLYLSPLRTNGEVMGVTNYIQDSNAVNRAVAAGIIAAGVATGEPKDGVISKVAEQFSNVQTGVTIDPITGATTGSATTVEGSVQITVTQADNTAEKQPRGISVSDGTTVLTMEDGSGKRAAGSFGINGVFRGIRGFFSTISLAAGKAAVPVVRIVKTGWAVSVAMIRGVGEFFQGFQGGRGFRDILGDWLSPLVRPFKMGIVPEEKIFEEHLSAEDSVRLQNELLDLERRYFDLSSLAGSYKVSQQYLSALLHSWGKEKNLRLPGGGWTSFLIIDRPEGVKGKGPFISRFQEIHKQGYTHEAVVVLAVTPDGRLILQHRPDKNQYDVGASGHVDIGETPIEAASNELVEELGIEGNQSHFIERLVPIPNPEREGGVFYKEGGRSFSEYIYSESGLDFSGPSKENKNRENVHLYAILLNEEEVHQVEKIGTRTSSGERGGAGFLPLQIVLDVQNRMTTVAALFTKMWFPQISGSMSPTDLEVDRVEMVDQIALSQMIGGNGAAYASSLRHFFQGEKIRSVVTGYLKGLLSAEKLGQHLGQVSLIENRNDKPAYGMTLVMGNPFPSTGILKHVVVSLREGLSFISHQKIKNSWDRAHATLAPLVRSKITPFTTQDLADVKLEQVLSSISGADPMTFELGEVSFGDRKDGSVILTLHQVGKDSLQSLREKLSQAGLPFKFQPSETGNRLYVQVASIGTEAFSKMTSEEIVAVEQWMNLHKDLKKWWELHHQFAEEKKKNRLGFSAKQWLETQLGYELSNELVNVWQMEADRLVGRVQIEPKEVFSEIVLADYSRRTLSALMSQGVSLPLGEKSEAFPDATSFIEQVAAVQAGVAYHKGKLKTDPIKGRFRPSDKPDAPYIRNIEQEERDDLAQLGLDNLNKGIIADLAAGAASRMANDLPEKAIALLKKMQGGTNDPVRPLSKGAVPIAEVDGEVHTFLGAFLTNVHAFYSRLRSLGYFAEPSILIYSNGQYLQEVESELSKRGNYGLNRTQIDTSLLQKLRPQFGGSVNDVMRMQEDGKFKTNQDYLVALEKARKLEQKLSQGKGEASLLVEEKAPHGHGEFLHDFVASGKLLNMIEAGKKWLYVRNVDNVGATVDYNFLVTLGLFVEKGLDFQAEVSPRLPGMKGGALLMTEEGQTILTEGPSFAATWDNVEKDLTQKGFSPLDEKESVAYVQHVFDKGGHLVLDSTQMDFEGHTIDSLERALDDVRNDGVRIYRDGEGHTQAVRYIVPESTYWFNNATGLISPHYFYYIYRRDADQTYEEFIDEMRKAYATNQGGLHRIAQRGKDRFPILLDAKPTKSGGVGQKPETNMWQSTQVAGEAGALIGAVGVDSLKKVMEMGKFENMEDFVSFIKTNGDKNVIKDLLAFLRFLATKQWEGKVESYKANEDLYPQLIKASWDPETLLPSRMSKIRRDSNGVKNVSKEGGFLNLDVYSEVFRNKWARGVLVGLVLLVISPAAMAAPGVVMAGLSGWDVGVALLGSVSLVGSFLARFPPHIRLGLGVIAGLSFFFMFPMVAAAASPGVALAALAVGAIKMVSDENTLFEQTGRKAFGENLIPNVGEQLRDLKSTTRFLSLSLTTSGNDEEVATFVGNLTNGTFPLYGGANWNLSSRTFGQSGEAVLEVLETSRNSLVQSSDVMAGSAGNLVDALGGLGLSKAREPYADHAVRAVLLANLAAQKAKGVEIYSGAKTKIMEALAAFSVALYGQEKAGAVQAQLKQLADSSNIKPADLVPVDHIQPGVVKVIHVDETSDTAMILNVVEMLERHSSEGAKTDLSVPGTGIVVTVSPGMEKGENAELIQRLVAVGNTASEAKLPIRVHQGILGDSILNATSDGVMVNVMNVLGLLNITLDQGNLKIQLVASPTSTVVFNREGLPRSVVVEKILWLLEGVGLRISSKETENEIRALVAALKAA